MKLCLNRILRSGSRRAGLLFGAMLSVALLPLPAAANLSDDAVAQIVSLIAEKKTRTPAQRKMDSQLVYALKRSRNEPIGTGVNHLQITVKPDAEGKVIVDLTASVNQPLLDAIVQNGGTVLNSHPRFNAVRARVPLANLETLAGRADVRFIRQETRPEVDTGSVSSEAELTQRVELARRTYGVDGRGVRVGVLSDSVDYLQNSQATGDLPPNVVVLAGQSGVPSSGEGTAMLEIIHDLAPAAELVFATAGGGEANFAQNILNLHAAGCDIIVDDVRYPTEPALQDGIVGQAVNEVTSQGTIYFATAGNAGNKVHGTSGTWEGDFVDGGAVGQPVDERGGNIHSFGTQTYNTVTAPGGQGFMALSWSDPLGAAVNDYDLFVVDPAGTQVALASTTVQNGTQDPLEGFYYTGDPTGYRIVFVKVTGEDRFLHLDTGRGQIEINTDGFARGHSMATNSISTGAIDVADAFPSTFTGQNVVEPFSSDGPRRIFYQQDGTPITPGNFLSTGGHVRQHPVLCASDGVTTTVPGFAPFFGTSAAAPHAAAIGALVKSYNNNVGVQQMRNILTASCLDIEAPGVDATSGAGILMADLALANTPPPLPLPDLYVTTNAIAGGNNNGIIDFNECNQVFLMLTNLGRANATGVSVSIATATPDATIAQGTANYPDIPINKGGTNFVAFRVSTAPTYVCGRPIELVVTIKCDQIVKTVFVSLPTGIPGDTQRFENQGLFVIPNGNPLGTNSPVTVSNVTFSISKIAVALHVTHTFDGNLTLELVAPDGTSAVLSSGNGGSGRNYGLGCFPESVRTIFDDAATNAIGAGGPPFIGMYKPQEPLSVFIGMAGTNVNGTWRLRAIGSSVGDVGAIQCWTLMLTPAACIDGGGECPGSNLALGMTAQPDPVMVGSLLNYSIAVTNFGPSAATNVSVSHLIPTTSQFISASSSQGAYSHASGVVTFNLGKLVSGGTASMNVVVSPSTPGLVSSSASISSEQTDFNLENNTATILTRVDPLSADLAVGLSGSPDATYLGMPLVYSVSVTNYGPGTATGATVTNTLPPGVGILSATVTQGAVSISGNVVICSFGTLTNSGVARATINAVPLAEGNLVATARVAANTFDPSIVNNAATITTVVGPAADLVLTATDNPDPVVVNNNLTYLLTVANRGPSDASAVAMNATLPVGTVLVSNYTSLGTISSSGNTITANLGGMAKGAAATIVIRVRPVTQGVMNMTAAVSGTQADPSMANNSVSVSTTVSTPFISVVGAGATLTVEGTSPANGTVDNGETVTAMLRLRNAGNIATTNLTARLLSGNGITPIGQDTQAYNILAPSDFPVARPFTFAASGANGGTATATLQIRDGAASYPDVTFVFSLPDVRTFVNTNFINLRDATNAVPYPSTISVSGLTGVLGKVTATLRGFHHTYPKDVDAVLGGPGNQVKSVLMSGAGALMTPGSPVVDVTFDDNAMFAIPDTLDILTDSYRPASYSEDVLLPAPAPAGPYPAAMSVFNGIDPNGTWSVYLADHATGDTGRVANGWQLNFTMLNPVNQLADLGVSGLAQPNPGVAGFNITNTFTVTNSGPQTATFVAFTNLLPAGIAIVSATASQGTMDFIPGTVFGNLGAIDAGSSATVSVVVAPGAQTAGYITNRVSVGASENDLNPENNSRTVLAVVDLPAADVAIALESAPDLVLVGSDLTLTASVRNHGPMVALNVVVTNTVPAGSAFVSTTSSAGSSALQGGVIVASLGDLAPDATATVTTVVRPGGAGSASSQAVVTTASTDSNQANNVAALSAQVALPAPGIATAGARLISESFLPFNGAIDPGETVTVAFALQNEGTAPTANLRAILRASGGLTPVGPVQQDYGALSVGGQAVERSYTFTANAGPASAVVATLDLQDAGNLGAVEYVFNLPGGQTFTHSGSIAIPVQGAASPYPAALNVEGLSGRVTHVAVTLHGVTHGFPRDLNALLVSPSGSSALLMSHAGGGYPLDNASLRFEDTGAPLPFNAAISSGTYRPGQFGAPVLFRLPAPAGGYGSTLGALNGSVANGSWLLYVMDDSGGDSGLIANGWSLELTTVSPINPLSDLAVGMTTTPDTGYTGQHFTSALQVNNSGPDDAHELTITNTLPAGMAFVSGFASAGSVSDLGGGIVAWSIPSLAASQTATASITAVASSPGTLLIRAAVGSKSSDLVPVNNFAQTTLTVFSAAPSTLTGVLTGTEFRVTLSGQSGLRYQIQWSENLVDWTVLVDETATNGTITATDSITSNNKRFYRGIRVDQ